VATGSRGESTTAPDGTLHAVNTTVKNTVMAAAARRSRSIAVPFHHAVATASVGWKTCGDAICVAPCAEDEAVTAARQYAFHKQTYAEATSLAAAVAFGWESWMAVRRVLALAVCLGLAACGGTTASVSPTPQAAMAMPSPGRTLTPTPIATPVAQTPKPKPEPKPTAELTVGSIATVVTDDLRVRSRPEVSDASEKLVPLLERGQQVFVVKGPVKGSGYRWYEVQPIRQGIDNAVPFGWIAAADKSGVPWIEFDGFDCPKSPTTFAAFVALEPLVWVACFGRESITFPARLGNPEATCGSEPGWTITPEWLGSTCSHPEFLVWDVETRNDYFNSVIAPDLDTSAFRPGFEPKDWTRVKLTGQFDHKAATDCKGISTEVGVEVEMDRDEIVTSCRATFVITGLERSD
jgi:hypothetical protein